MVMWETDAPAEAVARQLISTLFGVPQVSVRLAKLPQQHLDAVGFWLDFYTKNLALLHSDRISVKNPEMCYTQVKTEKDGSVIGVNYANVPFEVSPFSSRDARYVYINSSDAPYLCLYATETVGPCRITLRDCLGVTVSESVTELTAGALMLKVPVCGLAEIAPC